MNLFNFHYSRFLSIFAEMIRALFFDIDGTLVSFNTHRIPESAVEALSAAKGKGLSIFISTGRPWPMVNNLADAGRYIDGYITVNGAYCFIGDRTVSITPIPEEDVALSVDKSDFYRYPILIVGKDRVAMRNGNESASRIMSDILNVGPELWSAPVEEVLSDDVLQLTPFVPEVGEAGFMEGLSGSHAARWHEAFIDVTANGADKGTAMETMCMATGILPAQAMAFGDGGNDIAIIRKAGIGVAMGNASVQVKDAADYVTRDVDSDGLYYALEYWNVI